MTGAFAGRVVLVTGGVRGVGRAISRAFAARGAHVIVNYFHASDEAPDFLAELRAAGCSAELIRASVARKSDVDRMFDEVAQRHGGLDVLVNNAAAGALLPTSELAEPHWQRALDTNLRGSLWCAQRAAGLMAGRSGAIVNLSSVGSALVIGNYLTVGTTKAAVEALTRYLAVEFAPMGVRVNTASGGLLDGSVARKFPDAERLAEQVRAATPLGNRLGREEELAELVVFLASPAASWITGQTVVADGGLSLGSAALTPPAPVEPTGIAIVGMGVVTPGANSPDELWHVLHGDRHVFTAPDRFDIGSFHSADPHAEDRTYSRESGFITGFQPHPALRAELDGGALPSRELTTLWLRHCLHTALPGVGRRDDDRFLAAFGYTADGSQDLEEHLVLSGFRRLLGGDPDGRLATRYARLTAPPEEFLPHRVGANAIAGLLPKRTELVMVDTACSSSLYAIDLGVKALLDGTCEIAVCGGAFAYSPRNLVLFSKLRGLSRTGEVRSFDREASGVLFSDGAGVVVLKRLDRARTDGDQILGIVEGIGLSCDGKGKAIYAPNQRGQVLALRRAYADGVEPASVSWVVAHATGTRAGDSAEVASLDEVAGDGPPALLSSNKPIVGHTGWTAGLVSVVQVLQGLAHGTVPPQRYLRDPLPALADSRFTAPTAEVPLPARPRRAAVSSFGFGGTNAHLVLADNPHGPGPRGSTEEEIVVVGWSAHVPGRSDVEGWLRGRADPPPAVFGDEYPLPGPDEVRIPPATLRNMDRTQIMLLRAAAGLPEPVREACEALKDTTGVVVGHMGPTRRAVHYALRCYLGDLRAVVSTVDKLADQVRALVPASTEDAFPGIMPNIIASRLASSWDLHGLNSTVDTGPDASLTALRCAERYLRHGDLDLAVVAGVNGNSTPELADVLAGERAQLAEGAFLVTLTRRSTAASHGLPVLATIHTTLAESDPTHQPRRLPPLHDADRTYLGADGMLALLTRLLGDPGPTRISTTAEWGPCLEVNVPAPPQAITTRVESRPNEVPPRATVTRVLPRLADAVPQLVRPPVPALPPNTVVLVTDEDLLTDLELPPSVVPVVAPAGPADLAALMPGEPFRIEHVRVLAAVGASGTDPDDLSALDRLRPLHDLAYLAAQRCTAEPGGSFGVVLLDAVRDGTPHPACGPFTGLVKSVARECPDTLSLAVLSDAGEPEHGLGLWRTESGFRHDLSVVVRAGERRLAWTLVDATPPAPGPEVPNVIVAAGGSRGLTAHLLAALAERGTPTIYLLSRTPPATEEPPDRATFLAAYRGKGSVADAVAEHERLLAAAATARTVERIGAHHIQCDLTDAAAVEAAVDTIHATHDRVDLLINAAGTHRGGALRHARLAHARTVRDTKLLGYLNLSRAFAGRRPRRWVNFGSLLAVLGWPGEADYCSGNDVLNLAAAWRARFGSGDESTLAWPLWDETGFASEPVTRELLRAQDVLTGLSDEEGVAIFRAELAAADPVVTMLGASERAWLADQPCGAFGPVWRPDPRVDGYLRHHVLRGVPVLPGAFVLELAAAAVPGPPREFRDLRFHAPITAPDGREPVYRLVTGDDRVRVVSDVTASDGRVLRRDRLHAEVTVAPAGTEPVPAPRTKPGGRAVAVPGYGDDPAIRLTGPFRSLADVRTDGFTTTARFAPQVGEWAPRFAAFRLPVLLLDAMVQLGLRDGTVPVGVDLVRLCTDQNDMALLDAHGDGIVLCAAEGSVHALAPDGTVLAHLRGTRWHTRADHPEATTSGRNP